jgi:DNA-binding winged helix-turn-helix (wHTH) protein
MGGIAAFRIGDWRVEPAANVLVRGDEEVRLELKVMEVLCCLAGHADEVVTKRELMDEVWRTEFVAENTLTRTIAKLRRILGDDARKPSYIQTVHKRGYRLIAETSRGMRREPTRPRPPEDHEPIAVIIGNTVRLGDRSGTRFTDHVLFLGDQEIPLAEPTMVVGRGERADIQFLVSEVSRHHARLDVAESHAVIEDLRSKNGTAVNNRLLERPHRLASGDEIGIGRTILVYRRRFTEPTHTRDLS